MNVSDFMICDTQRLKFYKTANPIINLTNKKSVVFTATANDELEMFSDTVCRFFLNSDITTPDFWKKK